MQPCGRRWPVTEAVAVPCVRMRANRSLYAIDSQNTAGQLRLSSSKQNNFFLVYKQFKKRSGFCRGFLCFISITGSFGDGLAVGFASEGGVKGGAYLPKVVGTDEVRVVDSVSSMRYALYTG